MYKKPTVIVTILMLGLLIAGCAQSTANVSKNDGTYRATTHLILQPDFADRSFSSSGDYKLSTEFNNVTYVWPDSGDYKLSTEFNNVTYVWPEGKGSMSKKSKEIIFEGKSIKCSVVERRLTINGRPVSQFEKGDRVRITGDGNVFVNDVELKPE